MNTAASKRFLFSAAFALASACISCAHGSAAAQGAPRGGPPTLVVFITVDQFRGDYPSRFPGELTKGIARLTNGGAWFTNGFQDHAITETAPGHASTMSGRFPAHTGIVSNSVGVIDPNYRLLVGRPNEVGASPERL